MARQDTPRSLAGNSPLEMQSQYNISPDAQRPVPGIRQVATPQGANFGIQQDILDGLAEFGSKTIREAANARYTRVAAEGAMAYAQGKAVEDLPTDNNKWALEGYRVMEANTTSAALVAAQQAEISASLYQLSPEAFREQYGNRIEAALQGKDERVQDILRDQFTKAMPQLIEQHTREHAGYLEKKNVEAVETAVDIISRDTTGTDQLIGIARGEGAASGLALDKQKDAVIGGVVRAFANGNPNAYYILKEQGMFDSLSAQQVATLDAAKSRYESDVRSTYDATRITAETDLIRKIENGEFTPEQAAEELSGFWEDYKVEITAEEASRVAGAADAANASNNQAVQYEIKTAKLQGDYGKIADLTAPYANNAGQTGELPVYEHNTTIEYQMGPARPNKPNQPILDVVGKTAEDVFGAGAKVIVTSGQEGPDKPRRGSNRHKTGNAADIKIVRPDGSVVKASEADMAVFAKQAAANGATGIGFGDEYMGGQHIHVDLVKPGSGQSNVWASGAKAHAGEITGAMSSRSTGPKIGPVDQQKWKTSVEYAKGDLELAAVVYSDGQQVADKWAAGGREPGTMSNTAAAFSNAVMQQVNGTRYQTAQSRAASAEATYNQVYERAQVQQAAILQAADISLDEQFKAGKITYEEYNAQRKANRDAYGVQVTAADVKHSAGVRQGMIDEAAREAKAAADKAQREAESAAKEAQQDAEAAAKEAQRDAEAAAKAAQTQADNNRLEMYRIETAAAKTVLDDEVGAITSQTKPEGMSLADFNAKQQTELQAASDKYWQSIATSASTYNVPLDKQGKADRITRMASQMTAAIKKASENTQITASVEASVGSGSLNTAPAAVQTKAWQDHLANTEANLQSLAAKGTVSPEAIAEYKQTADEDFFAKSNYVPDEVRAQMSGPLLGELVQKDGTINPAAIAAVQAYGSLRAKSTTAANQLMTPEARTLAEAVLDASGGNETAIGRVLAAMWAEGLSNKFRGQPAPDWGQRTDVHEAVQARVGKNGIKNWFVKTLFGDTAYDTMYLTDESRASVSSMLTQKVDSLSLKLPDVNPKYLAAQAERQLLRTTVPVHADPGDVGFSAGSLRGWAGLQQNVANTVVMASDGADVWEQTFGSQADQYAEDRTSFSTAIDDYFRSDLFKSRYGDLSAESKSLFRYTLEGLPLVGPFLGTGEPERMATVPKYTIESINRGQAMVTFALDDDGTEQTLFIPLREIGDYYKGVDKERLTK